MGRAAPLFVGFEFLKHRFGALLAAANWQTVAIQFVAQTTFQVLLAVPIVGAGVLVAAIVGGDLADLLRGSLREMFTTIAGALSQPFLAASASIASASSGLRPSRGGTSSATTRSRSVTSTVSPPAASRTLRAGHARHDDGYRS